MAQQDPFRAARLVLALRQCGVLNKNVLRTVETMPREPFVPLNYQDMAYDDVTIPIECGQELSRPTEVGRMLQAIALERTHNVLEIGCGTGYAAAIMSRLARRVFTIDRFRALTVAARVSVEELDLRNVEVRRADGLHGWPEASPFDRIVLSGSVNAVPDVLFEQLTDNGVLIAPIDTQAGQEIVKYSRNETGEISSKPLGASKVLPLIPGLAKEL